MRLYRKKWMYPVLTGSMTPTSRFRENRGKTPIMRLPTNVRLHQHILYGEKPPLPYVREKKLKKPLKVYHTITSLQWSFLILI